MKLLLSLLLAFCAYHTHAWTNVFKKEVIQKAFATAGVSAALTVSPLVSHAGEPFAGSYADPKHPNCKRAIEVTGNVASLSGTDGTPGEFVICRGCLYSLCLFQKIESNITYTGCPPDGSGRVWKLEGSVKGSNILVDFTPKGGPANLLGVYDTSAPEGIKWPDGNKWAKI